MQVIFCIVKVHICRYYINLYFSNRLITNNSTVNKTSPMSIAIGIYFYRSKNKLFLINENIQLCNKKCYEKIQVFVAYVTTSFELQPKNVDGHWKIIEFRPLFWELKKIKKTDKNFVSLWCLLCLIWKWKKHLFKRKWTSLMTMAVKVRCLCSV